MSAQCQWEDLTGVECTVVSAVAIKIDDKRVELCSDHYLEYRRDHAEARNLEQQT